MNPKNQVFAMLLTIACCSQWMCSTQIIGPQEPSKIPTAEIVDALANARTQAEAKLAIEHLLDKTGVGRPIIGSQYNDYVLPDGFISELAEDQVIFLNDNDFSLSWGEVFEIEQAIPDDEWLSLVDFEDVVTRFREQATAALANPETPNNALLLVIAAEGYDETDIMSPIQDLLFTAWVNYEFQDHTGSLQKGKLKKVKIDRFRVECPKGKVKKDKALKIEVEFDPKEFKKLEKCLKKCKKGYKKDVKDCKKVFKKEKKTLGEATACANLKNCIENIANPDVQACVDACLTQAHDQGGGS